MKKLALSLVVFLMAFSVVYAQKADKKKGYDKKAKTESAEVKWNEVPDIIKASLKAEGIAEADVKGIWKMKKDDGKVYKFKTMKDGEKMKYKYKADGTMIKKEVWTEPKKTSS